jgi:hypothetical protein
MSYSQIITNQIRGINMGSRTERKARAAARKEELIDQALIAGRTAVEKAGKKDNKQDAFLTAMATSFEAQKAAKPQEAEVIRQAADASVARAFEKYPTVFKAPASA